MRRLHAACRRTCCWCIDEAYAEFVTEPDWETGLALARDADNIVVTRTFSKIHGLGGLRIGLGYAPAEDGRGGRPHPPAVQRLGPRPRPPSPPWATRRTRRPRATWSRPGGRA